ncbi:hypothetical protein VTO73DRAFT_6207 [Trametes versicolor]
MIQGVAPGQKGAKVLLTAARCRF